MSVAWHPIVVLLCISHTTNDVEYLFNCLSATRMPSLVKCPFKSFFHFENSVASLITAEF